MKKIDGHLLFSPTDVARFLENPYVTWMNRLYVEDRSRVTPDDDPEELRIVADLGMAHERAFQDRLRAEGRSILEIPEGPLDDRLRLTESALRVGQDVIYQGALAAGSFAGLSDFLVRVDRPSTLGAHSYEVWDTKLARKAKPYFLIQLCCYAEILESLQGRRPRRISVVTGDGLMRHFRTDDYFFYYRAVKRSFLEQQEAFDPAQPPEPMAEGKNGRWETEARKWLEETDHLSRVADIRTDQIRKLRAAGVESRGALAALPEEAAVPRMRTETLQKLRRQARLQVESDGRDRPLYEVIPPREEERRGLALLPPASPLDVAFDIEGYPLVEGGLEYLLGAVTQAPDESGRPDLYFQDWWAHDPAQEKASFESFVDWVHERWTRDPAMHVYHYAAYEVTALRRLMGRYGTREDKVDDLLRHEVFVDLYRVVHQGLVVGAPGYSLKQVERLYLEERDEDVATAGDSIVFYQRWLESPDGNDWRTSTILRQIRDYNEVDCLSTWQLVEWLRERQSAEGLAYLPAPGQQDEEKKPDTTGAELAAALLEGLPRDRSAEKDQDADKDTEKWRVQELLAWLVEFHRREDKPTWWRMFDRRDRTEDELREDLDCLAGIRRTDTPPRKEKRSFAYEFSFDRDQDTKMRAAAEGDSPRSVYFSHDLTPCTLLTMDPEAGLLELKIGPTALENLGGAGVPERLSLIPDDHVSGSTITRSIHRVARRFLETGELPRALEDFLYRRRPRRTADPDGPGEDAGRALGPLVLPGQSALDAAMDTVPRLNRSALCIQGPPGTGKTYTGAHVILKLLAAGKRVGVTSNSHKAICNLMMKVSTEAEILGQELSAVKVGGNANEPLLDRPGFRGVKSTSQLADLPELPPLIGGTAWCFSHDVLRGKLDHLFVDEAGQVALANVVGMAPSARNLVLLGDQMQLSQPTQGSHPGESGLSCLDYLLQDHATVPADLGIFLPRTWRMHPDVCRFISGAVYEDRLEAEPHTARRVIRPAEGGRIPRGSGILFLPVPHSGNRQGSPEEVEAVAELVEELGQARRTDSLGEDAGPVRPQDILVVAPYNLQVRLLRDRLGQDVRVGTIDKFQGQEAPVVIVSMAASSGEESPRGVDFLFDRNRINVAISRAQSLAIVVGNPGLARTACSNVKQMGLVNLFCRVMEHAEGRPAEPSGRVAAG